MKNLLLYIFVGILSLNIASAQLQNFEEGSEKKEEKTEEKSEEKKDDKSTTESIKDKANQIFDAIDLGQKEVPENMKYYKPKFEHTFSDFYFDEVWNAVIESVEATGCVIGKKTSRQDDEGYYKGVLKSGQCVFASAEDENQDVYDSLTFYSVKVPVIRGGYWENGRIQFKIVVKENEDETVHLILKGEISGFESNVTDKTHFWESSGYKEHFLLEDIKARLENL